MNRNKITYVALNLEILAVMVMGCVGCGSFKK